MTRGTYRRLALLGLVASFSTSCGAEAGAPRATLSDDGCTFAGRSTADAGRFEIEVENQTRFFASFGLIALGDDQALDEADLAHQRVTSRLLLRSRARTDSPPPYGSWIAGADVEPDASASLPVDTNAGRYAVACFVHARSDERRRADEIPPPDRSYVAAELRVMGTPAYP
ncbi:MAG TPA: hypothetical protein VEW90_05750 [Gaiellaceae bacterium]|nr:hypothetical protein [Gaiellaceae bacterium]